ncbi:MAG TPA: methyltransferase [Candidatus Nesterenkonia stercoripullorum]|uniref:Methyltransferase n=1 Tax=Candidatus Nesterenkonia stercoripullorum TaxID=2838701 RepID=A0A9D1S200_9MICC|nr:methyltransferase [Candidatus Nesterenkonia stercoripullorum]
MCTPSSDDGAPVRGTPEVPRSALTERFDFHSLSQWPRTAEAEGDSGRRQPAGQAYDAADVLLLDTAEAWWSHYHHPRHDTVVLDDRWGALTLPLLQARRSASEEDDVGEDHDHDYGHDHHRSVPDTTKLPAALGQDSIVGEYALRANAAAYGLHPPAARPIDAALLAGARTVLLPLPRSLDTLRGWAWLIAENAHDDVVLLAGGRDKHMTHAMNDVLAEHFAHVIPGRGRSKARVLTARGPQRGRPRPYPRTAIHDIAQTKPFTLVSQGAVYGGSKVDPGTRFLLQALHAPEEHTIVGRSSRVVDLGCGNGTVSVVLGLEHPRQRFLAADHSASAIASAGQSAEANGLTSRVELLREDGLRGLPDGSEELIVLNPPFHQGNAVDAGVAHRLIAEAGRVLAPGGHLYCVWNSHLQYRRVLERQVGPTVQLDRNPKFTVTRSTVA